MMAPVHPKPTNTASTGLSVVVTALRSLPARTAFEAHGWVGNTLSVPRHPFLVVIVCAGKSDHLPRAHIFVAAVDRIREVAFLGVLKKHREEGFTVDPAIELDLAALQSLEHLVLILGPQMTEHGAVEILADILVDRRNRSAVQLSGTEAGLITLFRSTLGPRAPKIIMIAAAEFSGELSIQENRHVGLDRAGSHLIVGDESTECRLEKSGVGHRVHRRGWPPPHRQSRQQRCQSVVGDGLGSPLADHLICPALS